MAFFQDVGSFFGRVGDSILDGIRVIHDDVRDLVGGVGGLVSKTIDIPSKALETVGSLGKNVTDLGAAAVLGASTLGSNLGKNVSELGTNVADSASRLGLGVANTAGGVVSDAVNTLWSPVLIFAVLGAVGVGGYLLYSQKGEVSETIRAVRQKHLK
jgi:hypothetical protein